MTQIDQLLVISHLYNNVISSDLQITESSLITGQSVHIRQSEQLGTIKNDCRKANLYF